MSGRVAIVVVSHSPKVADGTRDMVRGMVGDEVACAAVGGDPGGGLGSDPERIRAAIEALAGAAGIAVLVDMGGAEMNAEMVIESLDPALAARVRICQAPIVEGAVLAAAEAAGGSALAAVCAAAEAYGR